MTETIQEGHIPSYPKVYALGHKAIVGILDDPVLVEEKLDGSQFSIARQGGELFCRSRTVQMVTDAPNKMFERAVETAQNLGLHEGWIYRCEYLAKPHHNMLAYGRVPKNYVALLDVETGLSAFLSYNEKCAEAERLGLEVAPRLYDGKVENLERLVALLALESFLGGCQIEGVVIKNYERFGRDGKVFMGKVVSADFKELHAKNWRKVNPGGKDVIGLLVEELRTEARWQKAVQHRAEAGELLNAPPDIGPLMKMVQADVKEEEEGHIKDVLFRWAWPQIVRAVANGLPEWWKQKLADKAFEEA